MFHLQIVSEQRLRLACKWLVFSLGPAAVKDTQSLSFLAWKHSRSRRQEWIQHAAKGVRLGVTRFNCSAARCSLSCWFHSQLCEGEPGEPR